MKQLIILVLAFISTTAFAGLYECKTPEGEPEIIEDNSKIVETTKTVPAMVPYATDKEYNPTDKTPFLIYYAIDSEEPFMQMAVKYELAELQNACEASENVNYAAIINSKFTLDKIIVCKNKTYKEVDLKGFPEFHEKLRAKRLHIGTGNHTTSDPGIMSFLVKYHPVNNDVFYEYPLAHPDFVHDLIQFVTTDPSMFPSDKFIPYLNLKSHGSRKNVLSGLHSCQVRAKTLSQEAILKKVLTSDEQYFMKTASFKHHLPYVRKVLEKVALGSSMGANDQNHLGDFSLGEFSLGEFSLGANEGLGTKFSFGLYHIALSSVLHKLFNEQNGKFLGFVMLESCDTNRNIQFHQEFLLHVLGVYSASHSLWYRNLNWWSLLEESKGSSIELVKLLQHHTANIPNISVKNR